MLGAIAGDIIGSVFEHNPIKHKEFPLFSEECQFTDDSVLTVAVAQAILNGKKYLESVQRLGRRYPNAGYGGSFIEWLSAEIPEPYNSWGNGSAMRVSAIGWAYDELEEVLAEAEKSAVISHNHPEGIKGAKAVAAAVFWARTEKKRCVIRRQIEELTGYDLSRSLSDIRYDYTFDVSCQGSVPEALIAFLEADSFEDAVRNAISLGGDSDTQACIAGSIAEAYFGGIPSSMLEMIHSRLTDDLWEIIREFYRAYKLPESDKIKSL